MNSACTATGAAPASDAMAKAGLMQLCRLRSVAHAR
jgi:hypothetical protein